ncbi:TLDc domain-containing protein [Entamoeba marina]
MSSWEDVESVYSKNLINKLNILLGRLSELPQKYVENMRCAQDNFLQEFSSTTQIVSNLCTRIIAIDAQQQKEYCCDKTTEQMPSQTTSSVKRTITPTDKSSDDVDDVKHTKLNKEISDLKSAQESMWVALQCSNTKYTSLLKELDTLQEEIEDKNKLLQCCQQQLTSNQQYINMNQTLKLQQQNNQNQRKLFCNLLTLKEIQILQQWSNTQQFSLIYHGESNYKQQLINSKGIISLMKNQHDSIFGYFTCSTITPTEKWELPKDCDFCFSLRSLFSKDPKILLRKRNGKIEYIDDIHSVSPLLIEMSGSRGKEILYLKAN